MVAGSSPADQATPLHHRLETLAPLAILPFPGMRIGKQPCPDEEAICSYVRNADAAFLAVGPSAQQPMMSPASIRTPREDAKETRAHASMDRQSRRKHARRDGA